MISRTSKDIGLLGEIIAGYYLESKGYIILDRNYRTLFGEVDIIAQIGSCVVFCEVKLRRNVKYGYVEEQLSRKQQRNILLSADEYIRSQNLKDKDIRLDYISMQLYGGDFKLKHIKNAFSNDLLT